MRAQGLAGACLGPAHTGLAVRFSRRGVYQANIAARSDAGKRREWAPSVVCIWDGLTSQGKLVRAENGADIDGLQRTGVEHTQIANQGAEFQAMTSGARTKSQGFGPLQKADATRLQCILAALEGTRSMTSGLGKFMDYWRYWGLPSSFAITPLLQ